MPVDPNIALQVDNNILPGPMDLLKQVDSLRKLKNENMLFQMNTDSAERAGQYFQRHMQQDGSLDEAGLLNDLARDPVTSWNMSKHIADALARKKQQQDNEAQEYKNIHTRLTMMADGLGSLAILGDKVTRRDVMDVASRLISHAPGDKRFFSDILKEVKDAPEGGPELADWVKQRQLQVAPFKERMDVLYPQSIPVDTGSGIVMTQPGRLLPSKPTSTVMDKGPTPERMNTPFEIKDAEGNVIGVAPLSAVQDMVTGSGMPHTFRAPGASGTVLQPGQPQLAQVEMEKKQYVEYLNSLNNQISAGEQLNLQQESMRDLMEKARTGGLGEKRTLWARFAQAIPGMPPEWVDKIQGGTIAEAQAFAKKAYDLAFQRIRQAVPSGTQITGGEFAASQASGPGLDMDPRAIELMFNMNNKLLRYQIAERDFLNKVANVPENKRRAAWTEVAKQQGLLKPDDVPTGNPPGFTKSAKEVPANIPLSAVPNDGRVHTLKNDATGETVKLRRRGDRLERAD